MGKKLGFAEQLKSLNAIKSLYFSWDRDSSEMPRHVVVISKKTGEVILDTMAPINILPGTEFYKINIVWEGAGVMNFSSLNLFGVYWSSYNKMEYDNIDKCLEIYSSNSDKIVKVYS